MKIKYLESNSKLCTVRAHYNVGSALEYRSKKWSDGLAHVVEHMIYKQNEHLHQSLGLIGAEWNGSTYFDEVMFIASAPSENIEKLMDTLIIPFFSISHPLPSLARQTQTGAKFCLRDLRRQIPQSLRDIINAYG